MSYWFKPKQFWRWFAAYYPVTWEGWVVTLLAAAAFVAFFYSVDQASRSVSDTLYSFTPWAIGILLAFDLISFRTGEYPSWWKRRGN